MKKEEVFELLKTKGGFYCQEKQFIKRFPDIYENICKIDFPSDFKFTQKLFHYFNDDPELKLGLCPVCRNRCNFISFGLGYMYHCSKKCMYLDDEVKNKREQTCIEKYGSNNTFCSNSIKEKIKQTCIERYGVDNYAKTDEYTIKVQQTSMLKYNKKYYVQTDEFKEKSKDTCLKEYGFDNYQQTNEYKNRIKQTCLERYGDENYRNYKKIIQTKKKNHTLTTSKIEEDFVKYLDNNSISFIRQYKSELYPFHCDFYLLDYNLYIEIQGSWMHGSHPFDDTNIVDIELLNKWIEKSKTNTQYKSAITVWTISDVEKRNIAKENKLNYLELFSTNIDTCICELNKYLKGEK